MSYTRQINTAIRLIQKKGQAVTWRKPVVTSNVSQPWKGSNAAPNDFAVSIVFLKPSGGLARYLFHLIKGTDAPSGAPRGLMAPVAGLTPEITDQVIRNGSTLVIGAINVIAPDGTPILYDIEFA